MIQIYHKYNYNFTLLKYLINYLKLENNLKFCKIFRRICGGTWYLISNDIILPFWNREYIKSCNVKIIKKEIYL